MPFSNFLLRRRAVWRPDMYHGWGRSRSYFEGWYLKMVDPTGRHALALIPGISMDKNGAAHSFIQVMDGSAGRAFYHRFPVESFEPSAEKFELRIGENFFSDEKISLNLPNLTGEVRFLDLTRWPKMVGAPGIMGWFGFMPFMQCYHGVVSMNHRLEGSLLFDNQRIVFSDGGKGYIEKDWGSSFPRGYVWMQTNHFDGCERASLMASVAHIPWLGSYFIGFICGFWLDGKLYRFATYNGTKMHLRLSGDRAFLVFKNRKTELRIDARQAEGVPLVAPISGEMTGKINESLRAEIHVELLENGRRVFEKTGRHAGMELAGDLAILLKN